MKRPDFLSGRQNTVKTAERITRSNILERAHAIRDRRETQGRPRHGIRRELHRRVRRSGQERECKTVRLL